MSKTDKTDLTQFEVRPHIQALLNYNQADMDGIMVNVSRQAIHETVEEIKTLRAELKAARTDNQAFIQENARVSVTQQEIIVRIDTQLKAEREENTRLKAEVERLKHAPLVCGLPHESTDENPLPCSYGCKIDEVCRAIYLSKNNALENSKPFQKMKAEVERLRELDDEMLIFRVVAEIREIIGVGVKPMLSELPDAVRAAIKGETHDG